MSATSPIDERRNSHGFVSNRWPGRFHEKSYGQPWMGSTTAAGSSRAAAHNTLVPSRRAASAAPVTARTNTTTGGARLGHSSHHVEDLAGVTATSPGVVATAAPPTVIVRIRPGRPHSAEPSSRPSDVAGSRGAATAANAATRLTRHTPNTGLNTYDHIIAIRSVNRAAATMNTRPTDGRIAHATSARHQA
jgi:hypothetical protein